MLRVFLGFDPDEPVAYHVAAHSILRHASLPVSVTPLVLAQLPLTRAREADQSTEFTFSRFLVPWLCGFQGQAVYMDCDVLVRCDIAELAFCADPEAAISVVQHEYTPKESSKFLDKPQTSYVRKNWSSVMVFNCDRCAVLTPDMVNTAQAVWLRKLEWAQDSIGSLHAAFNHLVGEYDPNPDAKIVHFTQGTPCFAKYRNCEYSQAWRDELAMMVSHNGRGEYSRPPTDKG